MIVNPQEFNYRFILGSVIVAFMVVAAFGIVNYNDLKSDTDFLRQEKKLLRQELSSFIDSYDELGTENDSMKMLYDQALLRARHALDSLNVLKTDVALLSHVQSELMELKKQSKTWKVDSLNLLIRDLKTDKEQMSRALIEQTIESDQLRVQNKYLSEMIKAGNRIYANSFRAAAQRLESDAQQTVTQRANKADQIEVCFVLGKNPLAESGKKELYLQIVGPDNNVINDKGAVNFGELSLIFSSRMEVEYDRTDLEICEIIPNSEAFKKGSYYISVFEKERRLGGTRLELE